MPSRGRQVAYKDRSWFSSWKIVRGRQLTHQLLLEFLRVLAQKLKMEKSYRVHLISLRTTGEWFPVPKWECVVNCLFSVIKKAKEVRDHIGPRFSKSVPKLISELVS